MTKATFEILCDDLRPSFPDQARSVLEPLQLDHRVTIAVYWMASSAEYRTIANLFGRDQARGRLGRNGRPGGRNFALNGTQGEVGVSLKKKKKFFFFFLGRLIFILSPHKCKLW